MKKLIMFCLILCMGFFTVQVNAASEDQGDGNTIILDDGTIIRYDNNAIDGGIDLSDSDLYESQEKIQLINQKKNQIAKAPSSVELYIPFHSQSTRFYCGPASAQMLLDSIGYYYTQDELAAYLGTDENGTPAGNGLANTLTDLVSGSKYAFNWEWYNYNPSTINNVKNHIVEALSYGNPVMANTFETSGEYFFAGHQQHGISYHFGVIGDYFNYGSTFTYVDPAAGTLWYSGCVMNQTITLDDLCRALGTRGYVW